MKEQWESSKIMTSKRHILIFTHEEVFVFHGNNFSSLLSVETKY